ncbi:unnamed protein product [Parascedosporium putredinis]|uniref:Alcohol dehydrogenase n=1 Tax=Parascedosporium putredinis TaxID=1442378 RepID=A0A9P1MDU8_9PEZI|nr:unnamed protein product [Parascedosporium putredinis]CAI8004361.1 unnamed protein product [Parascedosporium putredinis]
MLAVVFDGPYKVSVQERPIPKVEHEEDIVIKVSASGLCGSELHAFRGHEKRPPGFIMGHEFTGTVTEVGSAVTTVKLGDKVVAPFTVSCSRCFYCRNGFTSRCVESKLFGSAALDGGQAEYVRIPFADGTVVKAPSTISDKALVLMADIWPTGVFGAKSAWELLPTKQKDNVVAVVIGCGPPTRDCEETRRGTLNFKTDPEGMKKRILEVTDGRGADLAIEVVGLSPALRTAFDLVRPWGVISSIGVHNAEIPFNGVEGYGAIFSAMFSLYCRAEVEDLDV